MVAILSKQEPASVPSLSFNIITASILLLYEVTVSAGDIDKVDSIDAVP